MKLGSEVALTDDVDINALSGGGIIFISESQIRRVLILEGIILTQAGESPWRIRPERYNQCRPSQANAKRLLFDWVLSIHDAIFGD